ncbi:MAG: DUF4340 domain-containing protein [Opitutaceae bacterium]|jgi:hypothetical protein
MKLKTILIVVVVLAVLSGASLLLNRKTPPADEADPRVRQPLVAADAVNQAAGVRISENGKTVLLKKLGMGWVVSSYHDLPVDFPKLARFVQDFANAKIERFVTGNPQRIAGLEFKDTKVALLDGDDRPLVEITLGKNADGGGRFLRFGDESKAYLAPVNARLDTEAKNWADGALTSFKTDDIAKVSLTFAEGGAITLGRAKKGEAFAAEALPDGRQLKTATVDSLLLGSLGNLRFTDTTGLGDPKAVAARAHSRTATLTTFAGKTITVVLGREPERTVVTEPDPKPASGGPAAVLGSVTAKDGAAPSGPAALVGGPITKTVPAGPVFAFVTTSDATDEVNAAMKKRAFQVSETALTGLPAKPDDFFEPVPAKTAPKP